MYMIIFQNKRKPGKNFDILHIQLEVTNVATGIFHCFSLKLANRHTE